MGAPLPASAGLARRPVTNASRATPAQSPAAHVRYRCRIAVTPSYQLPQAGRHRRTSSGRPARASEIEAVDVLLGEGDRLAEQDVVPLDLDGAEPAGLQAAVAG